MSPSTTLSSRRRSSLVVMSQIASLIISTAAVCQDQWLAPDLPYRVEIQAASGNNRRNDVVAAAAIDRTELLPAEKPSPPSFKLYESTDEGTEAVPCDYVSGRLVWVLSGATPVLTTRTYHLYFATTAGGPRDVVGNVLAADERPPGVNLVANGGFEAEPTDLPPGWEVADDAFTPGEEVSLAAGEGIDGSVALRLRTKLMGDRHRVECASEFFRVKPGTRYFGGGMVRLLRSERGFDGSGGATIGLQFHKADKSRDWRQRQLVSAKFVSGTWDDLADEIGIRAPDDTPWARVHLSAGWYGPAEALFDDISIVEMPHGGLVEVTVGELTSRGGNPR